VVNSCQATTLEKFYKKLEATTTKSVPPAVEAEGVTDANAEDGEASEVKDDN
jgi:hypothetical protein